MQGGYEKYKGWTISKYGTGGQVQIKSPDGSITLTYQSVRGAKSAITKRVKRSAKAGGR